MSCGRASPLPRIILPTLWAKRFGDSPLSAQRRDGAQRNADEMPPIFAARRVRGNAKRTPPPRSGKKSYEGGIFSEPH